MHRIGKSAPAGESGRSCIRSACSLRS